MSVRAYTPIDRRDVYEDTTGLRVYSGETAWGKERQRRLASAWTGLRSAAWAPRATEDPRRPMAEIGSGGLVGCGGLTDEYLWYSRVVFASRVSPVGTHVTSSVLGTWTVRRSCRRLRSLTPWNTVVLACVRIARPCLYRCSVSFFGCMELIRALVGCVYVSKSSVEIYR